MCQLIAVLFDSVPLEMLEKVEAVECHLYCSNALLLNSSYSTTLLELAVQVHLVPLIVGIENIVIG